MENYIVRLYRRDATNPENLVGLIETARVCSADYRNAQAAAKAFRPAITPPVFGPWVAISNQATAAKS